MYIETPQPYRSAEDFADSIASTSAITESLIERLTGRINGVDRETAVADALHAVRILSSLGKGPLEAPETISAFLRLGPVCSALSEQRMAAHCYATALALSDHQLASLKSMNGHAPTFDTGVCYLRRATVRLHSGDTSGAMEGDIAMGVETLSKVLPTELGDVAQELLESGTLQLAHGHTENAELLLDTAIDMARAAPSRVDHLYQIRMRMGDTLFLQGKYEAGAQQFDQAVRIAEDRSELKQAHQARTCLADCYLELGSIPPAIALLEKSVDLAQGTQEFDARYDLAEALFNSTQLVRAEAEIRRAIDKRLPDEPFVNASMFGLLATIRATRQRDSEALNLIDLAFDACNSVPEDPSLLELASKLHILAAKSLLRTEKFELAWRHLDRAIQTSDRLVEFDLTTCLACRLNWLIGRAEYDLTTWQTDDVRTLLDSAENVANELGPDRRTVQDAELAVLRARLHYATDELEQSLERCVAADEILARLNRTTHPLMLTILSWQQELYSELGRSEEAGNADARLVATKKEILELNDDDPQVIADLLDEDEL